MIYNIKVWKVKTVIRQCTVYTVHACTYRSMSGKSTKRVEPHTNVRWVYVHVTHVGHFTGNWYRLLQICSCHCMCHEQTRCVDCYLCIGIYLSSSAHCTMYIVHIILYTSSSCGIHCTMGNVKYTLYNIIIYREILNIRCTMNIYIVQYIWCIYS